MKPEYFHYSSVGSTNDTAKEMLAEKDLVFVSADIQTRGRGRNGKSWLSEEKNFFCSLGIRHKGRQEYAELSSYQYRACLAVLQTLRLTFPQQRFALKYPNDVYTLENGLAKKISGILVENEFQGEFCTLSIIGIGINVCQQDFPQELHETASSLRLLGENISPTELREKFISVLESYMSLSRSEILKTWEKELNLVGKTILSKNDGKEYSVREFDEIGRIKAVNGQESRVFDNGDSVRYQLFNSL